jgi:hypothetical protein
VSRTAGVRDTPRDNNGQDRSAEVGSAEDATELTALHEQAAI